MKPAIHQHAQTPAGYLVVGPRSTDAIGMALRGAYASPAPVPDVLAAILAKLDHR